MKMQLSPVVTYAREIQKYFLSFMQYVLIPFRTRK